MGHGIAVSDYAKGGDRILLEFRHVLCACGVADAALEVGLPVRPYSNEVAGVKVCGVLWSGEINSAYADTQRLQTARARAGIDGQGASEGPPGGP